MRVRRVETGDEGGNEVERQSKAKQGKQVDYTQDSSLKEEELPWVGFEPTTLCSLGERSTNRTTQLDLQYNTKANLKPWCYGTV